MQERKKKRPWRSRSLPCHYLVRVSREEHAALAELAARARMSVSRYLVRCGQKRAPQLRSTLPPTQEEREQIETLLYLIRKVGTNLNQLTHAIHTARLTGRRPPTLEQIAAAALGIERLTMEIRKRL